jgi:hypothetical protein
LRRSGHRPIAGRDPVGILPVWRSIAVGIEVHLARRGLRSGSCFAPEAVCGEDCDARDEKAEGNDSDDPSHSLSVHALHLVLH